MDLISIQDWANKKRESTNDSDCLRAIDALALLLKHEASPAATAKAITAAYENYVKDIETRKTEIGNKITCFWALYMCDAIRIFGSARQRLIDLLLEMSRQPDVKAVDGSLAKDYYSSVYWKDLPGWPWQLCDQALYYADPSDHSPDEAEEYFAQAPGLLNGTTFAASLFKQELKLSPLDLSTQADLFLKTGIENPYDDKNEIKSREWKVLLPASAAWLLIAGKTIYSICLIEGNTGRKSTAGSRRVWSKQTWEHWKDQLKRHASRGDFNEECRGVAAEAAKAMAQVELEHQG